MSGFVKLRLGNLFDGPTDLIVLPCSTQGTVTEFVAKSLSSYSIPSPPGTMQLGRVHFEPFPGGDNIAQYVAFAASVENLSSSLPAIYQIGKALGDFTVSTPSVRAVSAPLLGAGAGRLSNDGVVDAIRKGFVEKAAPNATLTLSVLRTEDYSRLVNTNLPPEQKKPSRVFISYTATSTDHALWVTELATFLRSNGIESRLDQWHLRPGMDAPQWMSNEVEMADKVIIVSDEHYAAKANKRLGGVGWETMLLTGHIYKEPPSSVKYVMIVRSDNREAGTPIYLTTKYAIHWPRQADEGELRNVLLRNLYEVEFHPPVSAPQVYI